MKDTDSTPKRPPIQQGLFQIYTGEGKGKSTASLGLMLRALGTGFRVYYCRMLKPKWKTGELKLGPELHPNLTFYNIPYYWALCVSKNVPQDVENMRANLIPEMQKLKVILTSGEYDLVILDEINYCLHRELIPLESALDLVDSRPEHVELVFTGRHAHPQLLERAALVTEMKKIKHPFDQGIRARVGIEF